MDHLKEAFSDGYDAHIKDKLTGSLLCPTLCPATLTPEQREEWHAGYLWSRTVND